MIVHQLSFTVYAVASRTYAFYSFNMIMYGAILSFGSAATVYDAIAKLGETILSKVASADASSTRRASCAGVKDLLLSVTGVVSGTNTACGEQFVDRLSKCLTHHHLARDASLTNSFVTGRQAQECPRDFSLNSHQRTFVSPLILCRSRASRW